MVSQIGLGVRLGLHIYVSEAIKNWVEKLINFHEICVQATFANLMSRKYLVVYSIAKCYFDTCYFDIMKILFRENEILFQYNKMLFWYTKMLFITLSRNKKILFWNYKILFWYNKILFQDNEILFQCNKILFWYNEKLFWCN